MKRAISLFMDEEIALPIIRPLFHHVRGGRMFFAN
jgi:hypothetical protein